MLPIVAIIGLLGNFVCTVGENIITTIKMRNDFCFPLKMVIFPKSLFYALNGISENCR